MLTLKSQMKFKGWSFWKQSVSSDGVFVKSFCLADEDYLQLRFGTWPGMRAESSWTWKLFNFQCHWSFWLKLRLVWLNLQTESNFCRLFWYPIFFLKKKQRKKNM
jgi:hypothetical protein